MLLITAIDLPDLPWYPFTNIVRLSEAGLMIYFSNFLKSKPPPPGNVPNTLFLKPKFFG